MNPVCPDPDDPVDPILQADLVVDSITKTPGAPNVSDSILFKVYVRNIGLKPSLTTNLAFKVGGETPVIIPVDTIGIGNQFIVERQLLLPIALTYLAIATIDPDSLVVEANENNNIDSLIFSVAPLP